MDKETLIMFRDEILRTLMNLEVPKEKEISKLDVECLMVQFLDPENFEHNREVLREDYYKTRKWRR